MELLIEPMNKRFKEININKYITYNDKSVIMKEDEFNFINQALISRFNKEVKELKKLYQATVNGDSANIFHSYCGYAPNQLVIIKSAGNRRFGGFTTKKWNSGGQFDKSAFLFSLDKKMIYPYIGKENYNNYNSGEKIKYAVYTDNNNSGPIFGGGYFNTNNSSQYDKYDIYIYCSSCTQGNKISYTNESNSNSCYDFYGDKNALSECGYNGYISIAEYEVFKVIFE